jgi:hypothetical protein
VHRPFGEQLEDGCADIATLAASSAAATTATRTARSAEAESATGIEAELEAAAGTEAAAWTEGETVSVTGVTEWAAMAWILLAKVVTEVIAKIAARLPALLMKCSAIARAEAEAESTGRGGEWVTHVWWFLSSSGNAECASDTLTIYRYLSRCNVSCRRAHRWP